MKLKWPPILLLLAAISLAAQTNAESAAQRQLREDRERFNREVDRQAREAKSREAQARVTESEERTRGQQERPRSQQSVQTAETQTIKQRLNERTVLGEPKTNLPSETALRPVAITPDFSVTLLADGNCVIHVKGRMPEIKSPSDTEKALQLLLKSHAKPAEAPATPQ
jgi:hypothetical protein